MGQKCQNWARSEELPSRINEWNFCDFLDEAAVVWRLNIDLIELFSENFVFSFFGPERGEWTQNEIFLVLQKIDAWNFSEFLHKVTSAKRLEKSIFKGIILFWIFMGILISCEMKLCFFVVLCLLSYLLKESPLDWVIFLNNFLLQSISCFKVVKVFNSWLNEKPFS